MKRLRRFPFRIALALLIFVSAAGVWLTRDRQIEHKRQALAATQARLQETASQLEMAQKGLDDVRQELATIREQRLTTLVQVKQAQEALSRPPRNDKWADAPEGAPTWNGESPYVWLSKATLAGLASNPFHKDGSLREDFANALAIDEAKRKKLTDIMRGLVNEFQSLQVAHAERSVAPPAREGESEQITVRIPAMPDHSARLKSQLESALEAELGAQRKELLTKLGRYAIESKLNAFGQREEKIVAKRLKHGAYEIHIGDGMMSGPPRLDDNIPAHLLPFFAEIQSVETAPDVAPPVNPNPSKTEQQKVTPRLDLSFDPPSR